MPSITKIFDRLFGVMDRCTRCGKGGKLSDYGYVGTPYHKKCWLKETGR